MDECKTLGTDTDKAAVEKDDKDGELSKYDKFWKAFGKAIKLGIIEVGPGKTCSPRHHPHCRHSSLDLNSSYDVSSIWGLANYAHHVIIHILHPRPLSKTAAMIRRAYRARRIMRTTSSSTF